MINYTLYGLLFSFYGRQMLLVFACCLNALVTALQMVASPMDLHYALHLEARTLMMAIIDYQHPLTIFNFGSILACESLPASNYYSILFDPPSVSKQKLVDKLMKHVFPHQSLHQHYLPLDAFQRSELLQNSITEELSYYQPGPIALNENPSVLGKARLRALLARVDANPALLGNARTGWLAWQANCGQGWQLDNSVTSLKIMGKLDQGHDPELVYLSIAHVMKNPKVALPSEYFVSERARCAMTKLHQAQNWTEGYDELVALLFDKIPKIDQPRLALWHGKLLFSAMNLHPECSEDIQKLFIKYLVHYDVDNISPYILGEIINQLSTADHLHFPAELTRSQYELLSSIDYKILRPRGFWGGIDIYAQKFIASLSGGGNFTPPSWPCDLNDAIAFFAMKGLHHTAPILFDEKLERPFILLIDEEQRVICPAMRCVLENLTTMIINQSGLFFKRSNAARLEIVPRATGSRSLCICVARLIIYNLIFRKTVGFQFSRQLWADILQGAGKHSIDTASRQHPPSHPSINYIAGELLAVGFKDYFPLHILLEDRPTTIIG